MEFLHVEAVNAAINIENRILGFYRLATAKVTDSDTRRLFERLTSEETEHLESLCKLYQGGEDALVAMLNENDIDSDPHYGALLASIAGDSSEYDALRIALNEEQATIEWYTVFVDLLRAPHVRAVFARILRETNTHCEIITAEYMRLMNMADGKDQDVFAQH